MNSVKLLVTHQNPDPDAIAACWLFMKWGGDNFNGAQLYFVPSGNEIDETTLRAKAVTKDETVHVDTGMGPFDHHQPENTHRDSATLRVYEYLVKVHRELAEDKALSRVVMFINDNDHFASCWWPEADNDRYTFMLEDILKGLRSARGYSDRELTEFGMVCLDGIYISMKLKVNAEEEIVTKGMVFTSLWGKALAIENNNDEVMKLAQKRGFVMVVRKEEDKGHVRIKVVPERGIDLTQVYEAIKKRDQVGTWYFHPEKTMLINGSRHNQTHGPTPLTLKEVVGIIENIK
jgi:hypothetical protein